MDWKLCFSRTSGSQNATPNLRTILSSSFLIIAPLQWVVGHYMMRGGDLSWLLCLWNNLFCCVLLHDKKPFTYCSDIAVVLRDCVTR